MHGRSASEWCTALQDLFASTRPCTVNRAHSYHTTLSSCPWCALERASGITVWVVSAASPAGAETPPASTILADLAVAWRHVSSVPSPGPSPPLAGLGLTLPAPTAEAVAIAGQLRRRGTTTGWLVLGSGVLLWVVPWLLARAVPLGFVVSSVLTLMLLVVAIAALTGTFTLLSGRFRHYQVALDAATTAWDRIEQRWTQETSAAEFDVTLRRLTVVRDTIANLDTVRASRLATLRRDEETRHRNAVLRRHPIQHANIVGIGPGRLAVLRVCGIATALDVDPRRIQLVPGFGPDLSARLVAWRQSVEARVQFDPTRDVSATAVAAIETAIRHEASLLLNQLSAGTKALDDARYRVASRRATRHAEADTARQALLQAQANLAAF